MKRFIKIFLISWIVMSVAFWGYVLYMTEKLLKGPIIKQVLMDRFLWQEPEIYMLIGALAIAFLIGPGTADKTDDTLPA